MRKSNKNQVSAVLNSHAICRSMSPKFIELCMETISLKGHKHGSRDLCTQLKYGHVLMVVNTSLRSINSVSDHGNMATPKNAYSSGM